MGRVGLPCGPYERPVLPLDYIASKKTRLDSNQHPKTHWRISPCSPAPFRHTCLHKNGVNLRDRAEKPNERLTAVRHLRFFTHLLPVHIQILTDLAALHLVDIFQLTRFTRLRELPGTQRLHLQDLPRHLASLPWTLL